jgi:hypothetical protein
MAPGVRLAYFYAAADDAGRSALFKVIDFGAVKASA